MTAIMDQSVTAIGAAMESTFGTRTEVVLGIEMRARTFSETLLRATRCSMVQELHERISDPKFTG